MEKSLKNSYEKGVVVDMWQNDVLSIVKEAVGKEQNPGMTIILMIIVIVILIIYVINNKASR